MAHGAPRHIRPDRPRRRRHCRDNTDYGALFLFLGLCAPALFFSSLAVAEAVSLWPWTLVAGLQQVVYVSESMLQVREVPSAFTAAKNASFGLPAAKELSLTGLRESHVLSDRLL